MLKVTFIKPMDQPPGNRRLLEDLKTALKDSRFSEFRMIVAYAKSGPLHRLRDLLEAWRKKGKKIEVIFGLDQQGTSYEALELALTLFDTVYVTREAGITFHPKIYLFKGAMDAHAFIGSNNLTVGGTEKNFESAIHLELELPADDATLASLEESWTELLPASCPATQLLNEALLTQLMADSIVINENSMRPTAGDDSASLGFGRRATRSGLIVKPESPLPKKALVPGSRPARSSKDKVAVDSRKSSILAIQTDPSIEVEPATARGFVIQIKPHHNGEIFLSVTAALQNPPFFKWPFNGMTTPKKPGNPSYPQLDPDPIVNITVYGSPGTPVLILSTYPLNTVYYEKKSEIRITASPLVGIVPEYSVMIMERSYSEGIDYEITIHTPDSPDYSAWVVACNQTLPGGGKEPRKCGWF